jgi:hypothetical protein
MDQNPQDVAVTRDDDAGYCRGREAVLLFSNIGGADGRAIALDRKPARGMA